MGRRARLTGRAEVKARLSGRFVVWFVSGTGRRIIVATLDGKDAGRLEDEVPGSVG